MIIKNLKIVPGIALVVWLSGCANMSTGEQAGAALLGCGAVGAIVGLATDSAGIGAAAGGGCLALGAAAIAINYYQSQQSRSYTQDQEAYGYSLAQVTEPVVKVRNGTASPNVVRSGDKLAVTTNYSVITPEDQAQNAIAVEETLVLSKDGELIKTLGPRVEQRTAGGWDAQAEMKIPDKMPAGTYVIEHKVKVGDSYSVQNSSFEVAPS
ncbi:MAG: hypothetical protein L0Y38_07250 [Methylococcaceae bacterium]|nr:hypothetical protein [Methylococcaceae bacterium]